MSTHELTKWIKIISIIVAFEIVAVMGLLIGRYQAKDWNVTKTHHRMESYGYSYCPYCGEELKEEDE